MICILILSIDMFLTLHRMEFVFLNIILKAHLAMLLTLKLENCKSKKEGKDQESIQSSSTPDPKHHMGK